MRAAVLLRSNTVLPAWLIVLLLPPYHETVVLVLVQ